MPSSSVENFIGGKSLEEWRKFKEGEAKTQAAVVDRLNTVIKTIGKVGR
jgi:dihydrodipicolinate synthase/N-acetylneuraminate lyase